MPGEKYHAERLLPVLAGGRADGGKDVGPLVADLTRVRGAPAPEPPAMTDPALVAEAGLVLEPEFEALVGVGFGGRLQGRAEPPFLKRCCASVSLCESSCTPQHRKRGAARSLPPQSSEALDVGLRPSSSLISARGRGHRRVHRDHRCRPSRPSPTHGHCWTDPGRWWSWKPPPR